MHLSSLPNQKQLIGPINAAESPQELHSACVSLCRLTGFDYFCYAVHAGQQSSAPTVAVLSGLPDRWWRHYQEQNLLQIDPTVQHCRNSLLPLDWRQLLRQARRNKQLQGFLAEGRSCGLRCGISLPVHAPEGETGMLALASSGSYQSFSRHRERVLPLLVSCAPHLHQSFRRLVSLPRPTMIDAPITKREQECLQWAAEGKTAWETALILGISERTVTFHLQNASRKLAANTGQQAVARAVAYGLVQLDTSPPCQN